MRVIPTCRPPPARIHGAWGPPTSNSGRSCPRAPIWSGPDLAQPAARASGPAAPLFPQRRSHGRSRPRAGPAGGGGLSLNSPTPLPPPQLRRCTTPVSRTDRSGRGRGQSAAPGHRTRLSQRCGRLLPLPRKYCRSLCAPAARRLRPMEVITPLRGRGERRTGPAAGRLCLRLRVCRQHRRMTMASTLPQSAIGNIHRVG